MNSAAPKDFTPVVLTEAAQEWIIKHFKHTKNAEIAQRFGISQEWLHRFARKHGLKKTPQFFRKCQLAAAQAAKASHLKNGTYPPKGFEIPNRHTFQKGYKLNPASEAKRKESLRRARAALMERERLRIALGEPQQTKIKLIAQPAKKTRCATTCARLAIPLRMAVTWPTMTRTPAEPVRSRPVRRGTGIIITLNSGRWKNEIH